VAPPTSGDTSARSQCLILILDEVTIASFARRHPALRWVVPTTILAIAATSTVAVFSLSRSDDRLPDATADSLVRGIEAARDTGFSGTVLAQTSLDLPVSAAASGSHSPTLLEAGSHTMRYWYGGPQRQRVALLAATSETDVFHTGSDVWQWDSQTRVATHSLLAPAATAAIGAPISPAPLTLATLTPQQLAERTLAAIDEQTEIISRLGPQIADRPTYELILRPANDAQTRIGAVHIDVDAARNVPLGVQVYARGLLQPSIDVAFTSVTYKTPAADYFAFTPPAGATVQRGPQQQLVASAGGAAVAQTAVGDTGWAAITEYRAVGGPAAVVPLDMQSTMSTVSGDWGSGALLDTPLLCLLVTSDGRVLAGSVEPAVLYAAAAHS
jgi:outer membrane lipoprotein-sorting protein